MKESKKASSKMIRSLKKESKKAVSVTLVKYSKKTTQTPTMALRPSPKLTISLHLVNGLKLALTLTERLLKIVQDILWLSLLPGVNGIYSGHVRVYKLDSPTDWKQVGSDIDGEAVCNYSRSSVFLSSDGRTVAIGAPYNGGSGTSSGHVRVYELDSSYDNWRSCCGFFRKFCLSLSLLKVER
jgi:hypothetical protein